MSKDEYANDGAIDIRTMSAERERDVLTAVRDGDKELERQLIAGVMTMAAEAAYGLESSQADADDLLSQATEAVYDAVREYDPSSDERFGAFLTRLIDERIRQFYSQSAQFSDIDPRVVRLHDRYLAALLELYPRNKKREELHDEEYVAAYLGVSADELRAMKHEYRMSAHESLETLAELDLEDEAELPAEATYDPFDGGAANYLDELMDCLTDDERYVVCAANGVLSVAERTDEQISADLGIDVGRAQAMYSGAVDKLRATRKPS